MPYGKSFRRNLFALVFLIFAFGCNAPKNAGHQCDASLTTNYQKLIATSTGSITDVQKIIHFYDTTSTVCRNTIASDVIEDLFKILYAHQLYDTLVIPFYDKLAKESQLSVQNQSKALLKAATFYLYGLEDLDKGILYLDKAAVFLPEMNDSIKKAYYSVNGQLCLRQSNLKEATDYYMKAIAICEKLKDSAALAANNSNFSTV
jgi:tetratricopeptide (TPR) repeat protein